VKTCTLPRNAPRFEKPGFDPLHCYALASLPSKPTFILQHNRTFQAQFLPQRLTSASTPHNHCKPSAAVLCHAKPPAPHAQPDKVSPMPHPCAHARFCKNTWAETQLAAPRTLCRESLGFTLNLGMCRPASRRGNTLRFNARFHSPTCAALTRSLPFQNHLRQHALPLLALNIAKRAAALFLTNEP